MSFKQEGWIGVDFDGSLARYDEWTHALDLGEPIPKMVERVKRWLADGYEVRVVTARAYSLDGAVNVEVVEALGTWMEEHIGTVLPITSQKDYGMIELWDDRAVQLIGNTEEPVNGSKSRVEQL